MYWRGSSQILHEATDSVGYWIPQVEQIAKSRGDAILLVREKKRCRSGVYMLISRGTSYQQIEMQDT
jgi:hypothetical protein